MEKTVGELKQDDAFVERCYRLFDEFYRETREYREKCRKNEAYWRANHWEGRKKRDPDEPQPVTPVLFSTLESMLSDMMDYYPEAVLLGEEVSDDDVARKLTQLVRFILKRRGYRTTYRNKCRQALKKGTSVQEIFWDSELLGGLGDVNIREWDIAQFVWDPKFARLQEGRACFKFAFYPREWFQGKYPERAGYLRSDGYFQEGRAATERDVDAEDCMLLECWWKESGEDGRVKVHMARLAGHVLLEDSRETYPEGIFEHGKYPFIMEALYPVEGEPVGLGIIDILQNLQEYADRMDQIIMKNALMSGQLKMLVNKNADLDEDALMDWRTEVVRGGRTGDDALRFLQAAPLNPYVFTYQQSKLQAIKEESGQTMFTRGESGGGVTAASAIVALQEAGSKRSRMLIEQMNDGFEQLVHMVIDLIAEHYTEERLFRIEGDMATFSADMIRLWGGGQMDFDVSIQVQKQTPYRTLYQNELALQLLKAGIVEAEDAIDMMTFEGKDKVLLRMRERKVPEG